MRQEPRWIAAVRRALAEHRLLDGCSTLLVGVSGGADSVGLLVALRHICENGPPHLYVAHLNHMLRGRDAAADAQFVRDLARRLHVRCRLGRGDVRALARRRGWSIEMAAREARFEWFTRTACRVGADRIALAHTRDDQAETVFLRMIRGSGMEGLSAMSRDTVVRGLRIIRPMLDLSREQIRRGLTAAGWTWREDSTNQDLRYARNMVRLRLLPTLERMLGREVRAALARTAEILAAEDALLRQLTDRIAQRRAQARRFLLVGWARLPVATQRRVLRCWLRAGGVPEQALTWAATERVRALALGAGERMVFLAGGWRVERDGLSLRLGPPMPMTIKRKWKAFRLSLPGCARPAGVDWVIEAVADHGWCSGGECGIGRLPATGWIRRDLGAPVLTVRRWRPGDRYRPLGAPGRVKISDVMTNTKVPRGLRSDWPLVLCGREIVWLPGHRIAHSVRVESADAPSWRLTLRRCLDSDGEKFIVV